MHHWLKHHIYSEMVLRFDWVLRVGGLGILPTCGTRQGDVWGVLPWRCKGTPGLAQQPTKSKCEKRGRRYTDAYCGNLWAFRYGTVVDTCRRRDRCMGPRRANADTFRGWWRPSWHCPLLPYNGGWHRSTWSCRWVDSIESCSGVRPRWICSLFACGANKDHPCTDDGSTALHLASNEGHLEIVRLLLQAGAWNDQLMHDGATPLHLSAQEGHLEVVRLVESAADGGFVMSTPLHWTWQPSTITWTFFNSWVYWGLNRPARSGESVTVTETSRIGQIPFVHQKRSAETCGLAQNEVYAIICLKIALKFLKLHNDYFWTCSKHS